ncbi:MAG: hypothetical protein H0T85_10865, partial [Geodermatophilaceae bacterium]|nr:hypothetical protein [Geodermatophilaceae bacterium]
RWLLATVLVPVVIAVVAAVDAGHDLEQLFELAIAAHGAHQQLLPAGLPAIASTLR